MGLLSGEQYLSSVRDLAHHVFIQAQKTANLIGKETIYSPQSSQRALRKKN